MKLGSVVVFVLALLLATTALAVTPMSPTQQMQALQLRLAQYEGRYDTFYNAIKACGGTPEQTAAWQTADANFNAFVTPLCGDPSQPGNYDTASNQCVNAPYMNFAQQYQAMQLRVAQYAARYAAMDVQSYQDCGGVQAQQNSEWINADAAMNAFLLQTCGGYQHYSTSQNQCQ